MMTLVSGRSVRNFLFLHLQQHTNMAVMRSRFPQARRHIYIHEHADISIIIHKHADISKYTHTHEKILADFTKRFRNRHFSAYIWRKNLSPPPPSSTPRVSHLLWTPGVRQAAVHADHVADVLVEAVVAPALVVSSFLLRAQQRHVHLYSLASLTWRSRKIGGGKRGGRRVAVHRHTWLHK